MKRIWCFVTGTISIIWVIIGVVGAAISVAYGIDVQETRNDAILLAIMFSVFAAFSWCLYRKCKKRINNLPLLSMYYSELSFTGRFAKFLLTLGLCLSMFPLFGMALSPFVILSRMEMRCRTILLTAAFIGIAVFFYRETVKQKQHTLEKKSIDPVNLTPYDYEIFVADTLLKEGYKQAEITQRSGDYGVDVLAVTSDGWRVAIQCKRYHSSVGVTAVQEVITGKEYYECDLAAVYTTGSYTQQAINLARKVHVKLYILDEDGLRTVS